GTNRLVSASNRCNRETDQRPLHQDRQNQERATCRLKTQPLQPTGSPLSQEAVAALAATRWSASPNAVLTRSSPTTPIGQKQKRSLLSQQGWGARPSPCSSTPARSAPSIHSCAACGKHWRS